MDVARPFYINGDVGRLADKREEDETLQGLPPARPARIVRRLLRVDDVHGRGEGEEDRHVQRQKLRQDVPAKHLEHHRREDSQFLRPLEGVEHQQAPSESRRDCQADVRPLLECARLRH
eukprot:scaffold13792_cov60-Phaeocystis_antarctica.AAC.5